MNQSDPDPVSLFIKLCLKLGCPAQNDFPNPMPQSEGPALATPAPGLQTDDQLPPVQPPLNQSEPIYEDVFEDHEEHKYMCMYI